jgi:7-cyano-7-deazaguanine tRNA-ribosyltransferase
MGVELSRSTNSRPEFHQIGQWRFRRPVVWLGHDIKHPIDVWNELPNCPGILINAHQVQRSTLFRERAQEDGLVSALGKRIPTFLDSGGFASQQSGLSKITPSILMSFERQLRPDIVATLDFPLSLQVDRRENHRRWKKTIRNTALLNCEIQNAVLAPVIHALSLTVVGRRKREIDAIIPKPKIVCIGGLVPLVQGIRLNGRFSNLTGMSPTIARWTFIARLILQVRQLYPDTMLHVFGIGSLTTALLLFELGVDSIDSVAWRRKASFHAISLPGLSDRYPKARENCQRLRQPLTSKCHGILEECSCPSCDGKSLRRRLNLLSKCFRARALHNAHVFLGEVASYAQSLERGKSSEFIETRLSGSPVFQRILMEAVLPARDQTLMHGGK